MKEARVELELRSVRTASQRAGRFDPQDVILARRSGEELVERLGLLNFVPEVILDLGCGSGIESQALARRFPDACVVGLDICPLPLHPQASAGKWVPITGNANALPFSQATFDLVFANLVLPWCDPGVALKEVRRILRPGGVVVFSTLGPDTLKEVWAAWEEIDDHPHVHPFADMHNVGDAVLGAGFTEPVVDVDMLFFSYGELRKLVDDLRALGATNVMTGRRRSLTGKNRWQAFADAYHSSAQRHGRLQATFEVVYAVAWASKGSEASNTGVRVDLPQ
jgi:malonyl-CoA O-methyltransferase